MLDKTCQFCENSTMDYSTGQFYCCDVSTLRMALFGPRPVSRWHTCGRVKIKSSLLCNFKHRMVALSEYNDFGACICIECGACNCHSCSMEDLLTARVVQQKKCAQCLAQKIQSR